MELIITFAAGISILVGAFVSRSMKEPEKVERMSIALALGALFSLVIFDLAGEVGEYAELNGVPSAGLAIIVGIAILKILDLFVPDHEDTEDNHDTENAAHIGLIAALAVVLHNIVEGMTVYSLAMNSISGGIIFAIGISMHNIPMGMLIYSTLEHKSRTEKRVVLIAVTLATLVGGLLMASVSQLLTPVLLGSLVSVATGMILFIIFAELIPHVMRTKPVKQSMIGVAAGFILVYISTLFG